MDLPTVLYRCPGPHSRPGGTYDYFGVETAEAYEAALAAGWYLTMPEATEAYDNPQPVASIQPEAPAEVKKSLGDVAAPPAAPATPAKAKPGPKPKPKG